MTALLALLLLGPPLVPDARLTPGAVATTNASDVCRPGYASAHRTVTLKTKLAVYDAYGLKPIGRYRTSEAGVRVWQSDYEVDHLISLQLGGSNDPRNLWIESYRTPRYNAHAKDALENRLHWLVCVDRSLTLVEAQRTIRVDWIAAYEAFITHGPPR